jgi:DNA modification methylase
MQNILDTIILGDCLSIMPTLEENSIDLILADYPFNCQDGKRDYDKFIKDTIKEFYRILKPNSILVVINNPPNTFRSINDFMQLFHLRNSLILVKDYALYCAWHFGFQHNMATIWIKSDNGKINNKLKWNGPKKNCNNSFFHTDVLKYRNGFSANGQMLHPQALPKWLVKMLIETFSNDGDIILDPFFGSGTTGIVCKELGQRNFIGIEFNKAYVEMAQKRLSQVDLFIEPNFAEVFKKEEE